MYLAGVILAQPLGGARVKVGKDEGGHTRILLEFRIGGLKEDLDTVKRRNDRLCLGWWMHVLHVSSTHGKGGSDIRHIQQHRQRCRSESLGPRF